MGYNYCLKMTEQLIDSSRFFVGGSEFAQKAIRIPPEFSDIPAGIALHYPPLHMMTRPGLFRFYTDYANGLIDNGDIKPPIARLDKRPQGQGIIINPGRGIRPIGGESPLKSGNEHLTPPALLEIRERGQERWLIRVFVNAFAYGYPRREILEDTSKVRVETVPLLSFVAALNPDKPIYDMRYESVEFMQLWVYALAKVSQMVKDQGVYLDKTDGQMKPINSIIGFGNIGGKEAGGSVETPHTQGIGYADNYAPLYYEGVAFDADGNCDRCQGIEEKLTNGVSGRVIAVRKNALLYVPETESPTKGEALRITTRFHISNWEAAFKELATVHDMVDLTQRAMWAMTTRQGGNPSINAIWAQGRDGHMFTQIQTGTPAGGFSIIRPVFKIDNREGMEIRPDTTYLESETIAAEYRSMKSIFPDSLNT